MLKQKKKKRMRFIFRQPIISSKLSWYFIDKTSNDETSMFETIPIAIYEFGECTNAMWMCTVLIGLGVENWNLNWQWTG